MAPIVCAINGFGRIGRLAMRIAFDSGNQELNIVHINDLASVESSAYLLKFDSVHGTWEHDVDVENSAIVITHAQTKKKHIITYSQCPKVGDIPVQNADVKLVLESTGVFLTREKLQPYFDNGVAKVVVSAPVKDKENPVANIVYGVNHSIYDASKDHIVTAASCTTNCLAPVVKVIQEHLGIKHGCLTTVHDVTNTQSILDAPNTKKSDLRRARSALVNLVPTSTGSATAVTLIFPELTGKLNGLAVRVPLTNASITDCVFEVEKPTSAAEVNALLKEASENELKSILGYEERPLVSTDYINDARSSIIDALSTQVIDGTMVKIFAWYDNEYGYSCRYVDVAKMVSKSLNS